MRQHVFSSRLSRYTVVVARRRAGYSSAASTQAMRREQTPLTFSRSRTTCRACVRPPTRPVRLRRPVHHACPCGLPAGTWTSGSSASPRSRAPAGAGAANCSAVDTPRIHHRLDADDTRTAFVARAVSRRSRTHLRALPGVPHNPTHLPPAPTGAATLGQIGPSSFLSV